MRLVVLAAVAAMAVVARPAVADPTVTAAASPAPARPKDIVYVEAFGKGGVYGIGVEHGITPRLSLGVVGSLISIRGQQIGTAAGYVHARLASRGRHALFGELGAVLVHSRIASPVASWDGMSDTGGGGVAGVGWEHAGRHLILRAQGSVLVGEGGVAPWGGIAIGFGR